MLYGFTIQVYFQCLRDLAFCVSEMFNGGKLRDKFVEPASGELFFKMWCDYFPRGCFGTLLKKRW